MASAVKEELRHANADLSAKDRHLLNCKFMWRRIDEKLMRETIAASNSLEAMKKVFNKYFFICMT